MFTTLIFSFVGSYRQTYSPVVATIMSPSRDSNETHVQNGNGNHDNAEKGQRNQEQDQPPEEVGFLDKNLRPVVFEVVKSVAFTSTFGHFYNPSS